MALVKDGSDQSDEAAASLIEGDVPMSSIEFSLDPGSGVPTYLQLVQQVEHALRLGSLELGDQLPRVKDVVASLAINPNTVAKAYHELETKGLTIGRPGQGTFIQSTLNPVALPELTVLRRSLLGWLATADRAGLDEDGIIALFTSVVRDSRGGRGGASSSRAGFNASADAGRRDPVRGGTARGRAEGVA